MAFTEHVGCFLDSHLAPVGDDEGADHDVGGGCREDCQNDVGVMMLARGDCVTGAAKHRERHGQQNGEAEVGVGRHDGDGWWMLWKRRESSRVSDMAAAWKKCDNGYFHCYCCLFLRVMGE